MYGAKQHAPATGTANQITVSAGQVLSLPSDVIVDSPSLGTTTTRALSVRNDTAATSGAPSQYSPGFDWHGHGWSTALGGSDRNVRFRAEVQPQSASTVTGYFVLKSSVDTGSPSWTNHMVLVSNRPLIDQSVADSTSSDYLVLNSLTAVTASGFGSSAGYTWISIQSAGTERMRFDWHAGNSTRIYGTGRIDVESATQIFFTAPSGFFMQSNTSINRTADATGTATQRHSYILEMQASVWTGSASANRFAQFRATSSTTVNLDYSLVTYMGGNDGNAVGTEVMRVMWDDSVSRALIGIGVTAPTAHLHIKAGTTAAESAPLKTTSGSLMTAPEAGAWEHLSDKIYFTTVTGPTRHEIVIDHPTSGSLITSGIVHGVDDAGAPVGLLVRAGDYLGKSGNGTNLNFRAGAPGSGGGTPGSIQALRSDGATVISAWDDTDGFSVKAGSSSTIARSGPGTLFTRFADVGNVGTGEDDLYSDTIAASTLGQDGDKIVATYQGIFTGSATSTQELRAYFGGTLIYDSGALAIGVATNNWTMNVVVTRESSTVVRCSVSIATDFGTLFPYSTYTRITGLTLTNSQILKITGEAAGVGAADNQIVAKMGFVQWVPSS